MNGFKMEDDSVLTVEKYEPKPYQSQYTNLFVQGLDSTTTDESLKQLFSKFGQITSAVIQVRKRADGIESTFGFVNFKLSSEAQAAMEAYKEDGKVEVKPFLSKAERQREAARKSYSLKKSTAAYTLYVSDISPLTTREQLMAIFEAYGEVANLVFKELDPKEKPLEDDCFLPSKFLLHAYVMFKDQQSVHQILEQIRNQEKVFYVHNRDLNIQKYETKEMREHKDEITSQRNCLNSVIRKNQPGELSDKSLQENAGIQSLLMGLIKMVQGQQNTGGMMNFNQ
jgi:RNA recognition motif-containing protein